MIGRVEAVATAPRRSEAWFSSRPFEAYSRAVAALDPLRFAGAIVFVMVWELASVFVSPIILPGPFSVLRRAATDFWSAPALSYYGVEDPSLAANLAYTAENVAIAAVIGAVIGVTLGLLSAVSGLCAQPWTPS
jgi:ABC-type nitrate/sulfonate/bicarbonate transport system permease component